MNRDFDYGPDAAGLDMTEEDFEFHKNKILEEFNKDIFSSEIIDLIQKDTIGQYDNVVWHEARRNRLTASSFCAVISRKPTTSCHNLVKSLLYNTNILSKHIEFGCQNEKVAIKNLKINIKQLYGHVVYLLTVKIHFQAQVPMD